MADNLVGTASGSAFVIGYGDAIVVAGIAAGAAVVTGAIYNLVSISGAAHGAANVQGTRYTSDGVAAGAATVTGTLTGLGYPFCYTYPQGTPFFYGYSGS